MFELITSIKLSARKLDENCKNIVISQNNTLFIYSQKNAIYYLYASIVASLCYKKI